MRMPVRRVYRAFKELDPYDDRRCAAFVRAARGSFLLRLGSGILYVVAVAAAAAAVVPSLLWADRRWKLVDFERTDWLSPRTGLGVLLIAAGGVATLLAGVVVRDFLLRRRLTHVLRDRGSCPACGYGLIGLAVSSDSKVTCPECGLEVEVDPSLAELSLTGQRVIAVADHVMVNHHRRPSRELVWLQRGVIALLIGLAVGLPAAFGLRELFLRSQAAAAARDLAAFVKQMKPPQNPDAEHASRLIASVGRTIGKVDGPLWSHPTSPADQVSPAFHWLGVAKSRLDLTAVPQDGYERTLELTRRVVLAYRDAGVYREAEELLAAKALAPLDVSEGYPWLTSSDLTIGIRNLMLAEIGRMGLAAEERDRPEIVRAFESALALARLSSTSRWLDIGSAASTEILAYDRLWEIVADGRCDAEFIAAIDAAVARQAWSLDLNPLIDARRDAAKCEIASLFLNPAFARWPSGSAPFRSAWSQRDGTRSGVKFKLGSYAANTAAIDLAAADVKAYLAKPRREQLAVGAPRPPGDLSLPSILAPTVGFLDGMQAKLAARRAGWTVTSAVERFRLAQGRLPESLAELVPTYLPAAPIDPFGGGPILYEREGDSYRVFCVGDDLAPGGIDVHVGGGLRNAGAAPR